MKCALICDEGFEEIVAKAMKKQYKLKTIINPTILTFETEDYKLLAELSYSFQSTIKVLTHVEELEITKDIEGIEEPLTNISKNIKLHDYKAESVKINCVRKGEHNYKSTQVSSIISKNCFEDKTKTYKAADIEILAYIKDDKGYVGFDFAKRALNKRDYKIFLGSQTLRGTIAFNLLLLAKFDPKETLLDPFMGSGTIPIEAGLFAANMSPFFFTKEKFGFVKMLPNIDWDSWFKEIDSKVSKENKPIYGYDSLLKFLKHTQKNAKIADINKVLNLSKVEVDWIDTKFEEESVDKVITHPPIYTEHGSKTKIRKVYADFLQRVSEILSEKASIFIINTPNSNNVLKTIAEQQEFEVKSELTIFEGKEEMNIIELKL